MKFGKFLRDVQLASADSVALRHFNYKALKGEIRHLSERVEAGQLTHSQAADGFGRRLEAELTEVACSWEACLWELRDLVGELLANADMLLNRDAAHGVLSDPLGPMRLLEPLRAWLPLAALADAVRRHRLLQITAVLKIEKKFVKALGVRPRPAFCAPELIRRSALSSPLVHGLCSKLEAAGETLLKLGLGPSERGCEVCGECGDPCSICLGELVDPARLPCGHRFCVHCVVPLCEQIPEEGLTTAAMRCPLCRVEERYPQALCLDSLLGRLGRRLSPQFQSIAGGKEADSQAEHFTAVAISSLYRLAAHGLAAPGKVSEEEDECPEDAPGPKIRRSVSGLAGLSTCSGDSSGTSSRLSSPPLKPSTPTCTPGWMMLSEELHADPIGHDVGATFYLSEAQV